MFRIFIILVIISFLFADPTETTTEYVTKKTGLDVSLCEVERENDTHGGFHGDGDKLVVFNCSNNAANSKILDQISGWNELPLSENLELIMYGGIRDGVRYSYELADKNGIPEIKNGYYYFSNRNINATSENDDDMFNQYSFNFTLLMYDSDNRKLYYYEFDT